MARDGCERTHQLTGWIIGGCLITASLVVSPRIAQADVVPPPPDDCPAGKVPVSDHGGPGCQDEPPENCPPGWRGVVGGHCQLDRCGTDDRCPEGKVCRDHSLCYKKQTSWFTYGRQTEHPRAAAPYIGGPPIELDEPIIKYVPINVCNSQTPCESPNECRPGKLCVPPATPTANPMPMGGTGTVNTKPSGCGSGCSGAGSAAGLAGASALLLGIAAALGLRRRRCPRRPHSQGSTAKPASP